MTRCSLHNKTLDAFLVCARAGSFSKAAELLYVTPTALIKQINRFENEIGVSLFERTPRGIALTAAGERLARRADALKALSAEILEDVRRVDEDKSLEINLGSSSIFSGSVVLERWQQLKTHLPDARIRLKTFENTREAADRILHNLGKDIDLLAGVFDERFLASYGCAGLELARVPIVMSMSVNHPLAHKPVLAFEDLKPFELFVIARGYLDDFDRARDALLEAVSGIRIRDFDFLDYDVFNQAEEKQALILNIEYWTGAHPLFHSVPLLWSRTARFGLIYAKTPRRGLLSLVERLASSSTSY